MGEEEKPPNPVDGLEKWLEERGAIVLFQHGTGWISADDDELMELCLEASECFELCEKWDRKHGVKE